MRLMEKPPRSYRPPVRPACPHHGETMTAGSSLRLYTYYYCGVDGCSHSTKVKRHFTTVVKRLSGNE